MSFDSLFISRYPDSMGKDKVERKRKKPTKQRKERIVEMLSSLNESDLQSIQNILITTLVVHEARRKMQNNIPKSNRGELLN